MKIRYELLNSVSDQEIEILKTFHSLEDISQFINIGDDYFNYVINSNDTYYYKVKIKEEIVGGLHIEKNDGILYLALWVSPIKQHLGVATKVLNDVIEDKFKFNFNKILVSIDKNNLKSINLFEKVGFKKGKTDNELIEYIYSKN